MVFTENGVDAVVSNSDCKIPPEFDVDALERARGEGAQVLCDMAIRPFPICRVESRGRGDDEGIANGQSLL